MSKFCYFNGKIVPLAKAIIDPYDMGFLRGLAVFDLARTYNGKPFLYEEHLARLRKSSEGFGLSVPLSDEKIIKITSELLKKNKTKEGSIRLVLTGGKAAGGLGFDKKKPTFLITIEPAIALPPLWYKNGVKLVSYEYQRVPYQAKTTNYSIAVSLQAWKEKNKAAEILYVSGGKVLEATTSNFFIFKGDTLITPKENVLIGITRNFVIGLSTPLFKIEEREISVSELSRCDEAFVTATNKEILPVVKIDDIKIGNGKVGARVKKLMEAFRSYTKKY